MDTVNAQAYVVTRYAEIFEEQMQAIHRYVQSLPPELSNEDRNNIRNQLGDYFTEHYFMKWQKRIEALPPKP